jgi:hypothetical protein
MRIRMSVPIPMYTPDTSLRLPRSVPFDWNRSIQHGANLFWYLGSLSRSGKNKNPAHTTSGAG